MFVKISSKFSRIFNIYRLTFDHFKELMRSKTDRFYHKLGDIVRAVEEVIEFTLGLRQEESLVACSVIVHMGYIQAAVVGIIATAGKENPLAGAAPRVIALGEIGIRLLKRVAFTGRQLKYVEVGILVPYMEAPLLGQCKKKIASTG